MNVRNRVEKLEQMAGSGIQLLTMWVEFVAPSRPEPEIVGARTKDGAHSWKRRPDEAQETFRARVAQEAPRNSLGVALVIAESEEDQPRSALAVAGS